MRSLRANIQREDCGRSLRANDHRGGREITASKGSERGSKSHCEERDRERIMRSLRAKGQKEDCGRSLQANHQRRDCEVTVTKGSERDFDGTLRAKDQRGILMGHRVQRIREGF